MKLCAATITVLLVGLLEPCLSFPPAADAPLSNSPNSFGALYKGSHEGEAHTLAQTNTDSRGVGSSAMQAGLAGSGKLEGAVLTGGPGGNKAAGTYFGDLQGQGSMTADTQSYSTPTGSVSRTSTRTGLSAGTGSISGGSLSSASGFGWRK
ncbi:glycine-rich protein 1-like isoform X1 [Macrobrachium rosenbergii]|uniref:glycine-rich protein 1-like isoform X1 n=1 Tax=Macrobrachium rosenbergii TaxID=79674 RepID=UPI0034D6C4AD